jgi:arsenite/tail-anchored protein-transporting ATPase
MIGGRVEPEPASVSPGAHTGESGRGFLLRRKACYQGGNPVDREMETDFDPFAGAFAGLHSKWKREIRPGMLSVYFLVRKGCVDDFAASFRKIKRVLPQKLLLSGPWPPYNFVNRLIPENDCPFCTRVRGAQIRELAGLVGKLWGKMLWAIPLLANEPTGIGLGEIFKQVQPVRFPLPKPVHCSSLDPRPVEWFGERVNMDKKLLLFAGKGGVGKTTLSCATALHLSRSPGSREVLLFSTDPAHSLSACLDVHVGAEPERVSPGLTAVGIDGIEEFEGLKKQYRAELEVLLLKISPNLDLTFDREVMEKVMDLSPPGLDEVMALTKAMDFVEEGSYDILVMDGAPSGHFVRLLEMPELVDGWLKAFFNLFLKYKSIFRLPGISARLVKFSRDLKKFRRLLGDPKNTCVVAVSILSRMAFEETRDLLETCRRMEVDVPVVLLNMGTPDSPCSLCSVRFRREQDIRHEFEQAWPVVSQALIYTRDEPKGIAQLAELGKELYGPPVSTVGRQ